MLGVVRAVCRAIGCASANGLGGGTMVSGDPALEAVGDLYMVPSKQPTSSRRLQSQTSTDEKGFGRENVVGKGRMLSAAAEHNATRNGQTI